MKKYRPKTRAANAADALGRALLAAAAGVGWFVWLWGVSLPALAAGLAFGALLWMCARLLGKKRVAKREQQLRRMIGGELALDRLLLMPAKHAAFQAALWVAPRYPLVMHKAVDWCVTGTLNGKPAALRLIAQHESVPVTAQQLVEAARELGERKAESCVLCVTAPLTREAESYLAAAPFEMDIVKREALAAFAGYCSPATDEDLARLRQQKKRRRTLKQWADAALDPSRAKRYLWYGASMGALALLTGQWAYPAPAVACLALYAGCRMREYRAGARGSPTA